MKSHERRDEQRSDVGEGYFEQPGHWIGPVFRSEPPPSLEEQVRELWRVVEDLQRELWRLRPHELRRAS